MPLDGDVDRLIHCVDDFKLDMYPTPCNLESTRTFTMSCRMHIPSSGSRQLPAVVAGAVRRTAYPQRVWMPDPTQNRGPFGFQCSLWTFVNPSSIIRMSMCAYIYVYIYILYIYICQYIHHKSLLVESKTNSPNCWGPFSATVPVQVQVPQCQRLFLGLRDVGCQEACYTHWDSRSPPKHENFGDLVGDW